VTPTQQARVQGFNASLEMRGVLVSLEGDPNNTQFNALLQRIPPPPDKYPLSSELRTADKISILNSDLEAADVLIEPGSTFLSADGTTRYRVSSVDNNPLDIKTTFTCETSQVPTA
jgi:hypothetical protein